MGDEWHGWRKPDSDTALHIGYMPGKKRPSLYAAQSNEFVARMWPLASFANEEAARFALDMIDRLTNSDA